MQFGHVKFDYVRVHNEDDIGGVLCFTSLVDPQLCEEFFV